MTTLLAPLQHSLHLFFPLHSLYSFLHFCCLPLSPLLFALCGTVQRATLKSLASAAPP